MSGGLKTTFMRVSPVAIAAAIVFLLAGCGSGSNSTTSAEQHPGNGGSMEAALGGGEIETLDPSSALGGSSIYVVSQIVESLYKLNVKGELEPWLATGAQKKNKETTWIFNLRTGVKFSNGKPMTAEDAAFSIDVARKSANYANLFENFQTVTATSPTTLEITTDQPMPSMEAILSSWVAAVIPKGYGGMSEKQFAEHPIGTGPFMLKSWNHGSSVALERNPHYWKPNRPYLQELTFVNAPEDNSRIAQLRGGKLSVIETPPLAQLETLEHETGFSVAESSPPAQAKYVLVNARNKKFQDPRVREAIDLAIDRPAIVKAGLSGHGELGASFLVPSLPYHDFGLQPPARDVAKAKKLLAEAKADGSDSTFTLLIAAGVAGDAIASQIIQQDLEEVGFKVNIQSLDPASLLEQLSQGEYEVAIEALSAGVPDPSENVALYLSTESFFTGAENKTVSRLAEEGAIETNDAKRREIYYQLQKEVADERFLITLCYEPYFWGVNDEVVGFEPNPLGYVWYSELGLAQPGS